MRRRHVLVEMLVRDHVRDGTDDLLQDWRSLHGRPDGAEEELPPRPVSGEQEVTDEVEGDAQHPDVEAVCRVATARARPELAESGDQAITVAVILVERADQPVVALVYLGHAHLLGHEVEIRRPVPLDGGGIIFKQPPLPV